MNLDLHFYYLKLLIIIEWENIVVMYKVINFLKIEWSMKTITEQ